MAFSSILFVFAFLPLTLSVYWAAPARARNAVALAAGLAFYAWGAPRFVFVLAASCALDYSLTRGMGAPAAAGRRRRRLLCAGLAANLGLLAFFKYANFAVGEANAMLAGLGCRTFHWEPIVLPLAISFFTFRKVSYLMDVYRRVSPPARSLPAYLLYVSLFPQLVCGPISRYRDIAPQIDSRRLDPERILSGIVRFSAGLAKKVLLANTLAAAADAVFAASPRALSPASAAMGMLCYSLQIYFDFAGYSDMAIGVGRMMGFETRENFNHPCIARSFTDFWRRWHITLTDFMRDYLYFPLGGNRRGRFRTYLNQWVVFTLSGLWHGASWTFVLWGVYHGLFMTLDRIAGERGVRQPPAWLATPLTFALVTVGWTIFRADTPGHAMALLRQAFVAPWLPAGAQAPALPGVFGAQTMTAVAVALLLAFVPAILPQRRLAGARMGLPAPRVAARFAGAMLLLVLCASAMASGSFSPFIYLRF